MARRIPRRISSTVAHTDAAALGTALFAKYGPTIGWDQLAQILLDPQFARYPCDFCFNAEPLLPGELAHPMAKGTRPEDGYRICLHPVYVCQFAAVPALVLYQLFRVNYGPLASPDDAETFVSQALGMTKDHYYTWLCRLAEQLPEGEEQGLTEP